MVSDNAENAFAKSLVAFLAQPAAVLCSSGIVLACNRDFLSAFTGVAGDASGLALVDLLRPAERPAIHTHFGKDQGQDSSLVTRVDLPSGQFKLSLSAVLCRDGRALHLCQLTPDLVMGSTRLRFLLEHLDQGVWNYNVLTETFSVTGAWLRMRNLPDDFDINDHQMRSAYWNDTIHPDDREKLRRLFEGQVSGESEAFNVSYRFRREEKDDWIWIHSRASVMSRDHTGRPVQIVGLDTDITSIKENEAAHKEMANKLQLANDVAGVGVWEYDVATKAVYWDDRVLEIYGLSDGKNQRPRDLWETYLHPEDREEAVAEANAVDEGHDFKRDYRIVRPSGEVRYVRSIARMIDNAPGTSAKLVGVNLDITEDYLRTEELERARKLLEHDAHHDALTGLANRRLLDDATFTLMRDLGPEDRFAVLHIDLDHFKQVNDGLGHAAGDKVLVHVADMLKTHIGADGLVCRSGGDEFVVLMHRPGTTKALRALCQTLVDEMKGPVEIDGQRCKVGLSIGCAVGRGDTDDASEVFLNADVALYAAKSDGRSCYRVFTPSLRTVSRVEASAHHDLCSALRDGQLICHYQPQFDGTTLQMIGAEALVRWDCPNRGLLLPEAFMPIARKTGLVPRVDEYVLDHVLQAQTGWAEAGLEVPLVALNICLERLIEPSFLRQIRESIKSHHAVAFELLETSLLDHCDGPVMHVLDQLREAGIRIDLDDFGSGHSSVVALQAVRPDRVKVDQMLVRPLSTTPAQIHILKALSDVARHEGCGVVIEGIEDTVQLEAMKGLDVQALQGFLLGHPLPAEAFSNNLSMRPMVVGR
jgi:diguanylate cyclase (GGDEF)-like protein/PAS domain S-box-containing protein